MKNMIKPISIAVILLAVYSGNSLANKIHKKIDVKCYVEFLGGAKEVTLWRIKQSRLDSFVTEIVGKKVAASGYSKKEEIYKAFECLPYDKKFRDKTAQSKFEKMDH